MPRTSKTTSTSETTGKKKWRKGKSKPEPRTLVDKARGSTSGYALDDSNTAKATSTYTSTKDVYGRRKRKRYGNGRMNETPKPAPHPRVMDTIQRKFRGNGNGNNEAELSSSSATAAAKATAFATPAYLKQNQNLNSNHPSEFESESKKTSQTPFNPYTNKKSGSGSANGYRSRYAPPSSAKRSSSNSNSNTNHYNFPPSSSSSSTHIICAISENLARETCITTLDAAAPVTLQVHKMGNGQMYAETMCFIQEMMDPLPHEILLNEGRKNSILCQKIVDIFGDGDGDGDGDNDGDDNTRSTNTNKNAGKGADLTGACSTKTVIKFVPRSYFDQNRGADLLRTISRPNAYDASVVEEYILLSAAHALLQYLQICLGATFAAGTLDICWNGNGNESGGNGKTGTSGTGAGTNTSNNTNSTGIRGGKMHRMAIDRSTIAHLELLSNAKTGKTQNSLIGTIDCTKTSVGSRLLRTNLMSPPTRLDTITARLDLVDSFLEDEQFFYEIMDQLLSLPDVEKMLAHMALVPKNRGATNGSGSGGGTRSGRGGKRQVTARMASKGISALVCIKSALSVVPHFARVLDIQLKTMLKRDKRNEAKEKDKPKAKVNGTGSGSSIPSADVDIDVDPKRDMRKNRSSHRGDDGSHDSDNDDDDSDDDSNASKSSISDESSVEGDGHDNSDIDIDVNNESGTIASSLLLGLGSGPLASTSTTGSGNNNHCRYQLLRAILVAMKNPQLKEILDAVMDIFTESTTYSKNSHAMRHQECFALKPNTDGMMVRSVTHALQNAQYIFARTWHMFS